MTGVFLFLILVLALVGVAELFQINRRLKALGGRLEGDNVELRTGRADEAKAT